MNEKLRLTDDEIAEAYEETDASWLRYQKIRDAQIAKLISLGWKNPEEIERAEHAERQRIINIIDSMLEGMGYDRTNFKTSDWQCYEALKAERGGRK